jgi:hypothetical protein
MTDQEYGMTLQAIANEFRLLMQEHCTPKELTAIDLYNKLGDDPKGCASYDIMMLAGPEPLMRQAFMSVMGRPADLSALSEPMAAGRSEEDCKLWEDAWMRAKEDGFSKPVRSPPASDRH